MNKKHIIEAPLETLFLRKFWITIWLVFCSIIFIVGELKPNYNSTVKAYFFDGVTTLLLFPFIIVAPIINTLSQIIGLNPAIKLGFIAVTIITLNVLIILSIHYISKKKMYSKLLAGLLLLFFIANFIRGVMTINFVWLT